jgi:hypothetical protein
MKENMDGCPDKAVYAVEYEKLIHPITLTVRTLNEILSINCNYQMMINNDDIKVVPRLQHRSSSLPPH